MLLASLARETGRVHHVGLSGQNGDLAGNAKLVAKGGGEGGLGLSIVSIALAVELASVGSSDGLLEGKHVLAHFAVGRDDTSDEGGGGRALAVLELDVGDGEEGGIGVSFEGGLIQYGTAEGGGGEALGFTSVVLIEVFELGLLAGFGGGMYAGDVDPYLLGGVRVSE